MKKVLFFSLLTLALSMVLCPDLHAQRKGKKKKPSKTDEYFDESGFANKLWYGGNFTLGFSGSGETNVFVFGLSPMVGYKVLNDIVSVGPRAGFTYNFYKGRGNDLAIHKVNAWSYALGAFARIKPITNVFAHFEYEYENAKAVYVDQFGYLAVQNGEVVTAREPRDNVYIGLGYHSGGLWGYELLLLYNVNQPDNTVDLPFSLRFGITYRF